MKYRLFDYDVWADGQDGWQVNQIFATDTYIDGIGDVQSDDEIIKIIRKSGILKKYARIRIAPIGDVIIYIESPSGKPLFELRPA